jgi:hypothetical protein
MSKYFCGPINHSFPKKQKYYLHNDIINHEQQGIPALPAKALKSMHATFLGGSPWIPELPTKALKSMLGGPPSLFQDLGLSSSNFGPNDFQIFTVGLFLKINGDRIMGLRRWMECTRSIRAWGLG